MGNGNGYQRCSQESQRLQQQHEPSQTHHHAANSLRAIHGTMRAWEHYVRAAAAVSASSNSYNNNEFALTLDALEVDIQASCTGYLQQQCEKLPFNQQPRHLCLTFNQFDSQLLLSSSQPSTINKNSPGGKQNDHDRSGRNNGEMQVVEEEEVVLHDGYLSRWLRDTDLGTELRGLVLRPTMTFAGGLSLFNDWHHKSCFDRAWQRVVCSIFQVLSSADRHICRLQELTIHELLLFPDSATATTSQEEDDNDSSMLSSSSSMSTVDAGAAYGRFGSLLRDLLMAAGRPVQPLKPVSTLKSLVLQDLTLTLPLARQIAQGLRGAAASQLETLSLSNCKLSTKMLDEVILQGLLVGTSANDSIDEAKVKILLQLKNLFLGRNQFTAVVLSGCLRKLLERAPNLEKFDLSFNDNLFDPTLRDMEDYGSTPLSQQPLQADQVLQWERRHVLAFLDSLQTHGTNLKHLWLRHVVPQAANAMIPLMISRLFSSTIPTMKLKQLQLDVFSLSREKMVGSSNRNGPSSFCLQQGIYSDNAHVNFESLAFALQGLVNVADIRALKLQGCHVVGTVMGQALESFLQSRQLHQGNLAKMTFSQCKFDQTATSFLTRALQETRSEITELLFDFSALTDDRAIILLQQQSNSTNRIPQAPGSITSLDGNMCGGLLQNVSFRSNQLTLHCLDHFTQLLTLQPNLSSLDLSLNLQLFEGLDCESKIQAFCQVLESHSSLQKVALSLGSNSTHAAIAIQHLFQTLESKRCPLQKLVFKDSLCFPTRSDWLSSLGRIHGLTHLLLPQVFLDDANWDMFLSALRRNTSLQRCDFDRSYSTLGPVARILRRNEMLVRVQLFHQGKHDTHRRNSSFTMMLRPLMPHVLHILGAPNLFDASPAFLFIKSTADVIV